MIRLTTFLKTKEMGAPRLTRPRGDGGPVDSFSALGDPVIGLQKLIEKSGLASVGGTNQVDIAAVAPGALERGDQLLNSITVLALMSRTSLSTVRILDGIFAFSSPSSGRSPLRCCGLR